MNRLNTYQWLAKFLQKIGVKKKTEKEKKEPKEIRYIDRKDRYVWFVLIIGFLLALLSVKSCNLVKNMVCDCDRSIPSGKETVRIDTVELPSPPPDTIKIPILKPYEVRVPDLSLQHKIDSLLQENQAKDVLLAYYEERYYKRVLKDDSIAYAVLFDTVSENSLKEGRFIFELRQKPKRITTTITTEKELKLRGYYGGAIKYNQETGQLSAEAKLNFIPKNDRVIVEVSYDPFNQTWGAGASFKIGGK